MEKLRMKLDTLTVQSFETAALPQVVAVVAPSAINRTDCCTIRETRADEGVVC